MPSPKGGQGGRSPGEKGVGDGRRKDRKRERKGREVGEERAGSGSSTKAGIIYYASKDLSNRSKAEN